MGVYGGFCTYRCLGTPAWVFKEGFAHIDLWEHQHGHLRRVLHIYIFGDASMDI